MKKYFRNITKPKWYVLTVSAIIYIWQCSALIPACRELGGEYYAIIPIQLLVGLMDIMLYLIVQKEKWKKLQIPIYLASIVLGTIIVNLVISTPFALALGIIGIIHGVVLCMTAAIIICVLINIIKALIVKEDKELELEAINTSQIID